MSPRSGPARAAKPRIALIAGEVSGDRLGAGLIAALARRWPQARFEGVAGQHMSAAGCRALASSEELAVMGLAEVVAHLPRLLRLRRRLLHHWLAEPPDVFVGIDAPEFNLALERRLRAAGVPTVHYVSPSVWAWRPGRVKGIARSVELMLTLFPFEAQFYRDRGVAVRCVGHPMADEIAASADVQAPRRALGLDAEGPLVALLPGSRLSEVNRLGAPLAHAAAWLLRRRPHLRFVAPMATSAVGTVFRGALEEAGVSEHVCLLAGQAREAMAAADVVLLASGTATLEALLLGRPMVVAYQISPVSAWVARRLRLINTAWFSLPNLLSIRAGGPALVPEFIQEAVDPASLGAAVEALLDSPQRRAAQVEAFGALHETLRRDADREAAQAVSELLQGRPA